MGLLPVLSVLLCTGSRPLNSALEVDLDFERALKPPPLPTEEFTMSLEDLIKRRIAELQFDDPMRKAAPTTELQKDFAEIDDKKANKASCSASILAARGRH